MMDFPFVPQPYPDEILGSWLARISLLNGSGAWRTLLETCGYGRRMERPLFDIPTYDSKIHCLLGHLGVSYEDTLMNLTTYPYWATFESTNEFIKGSSKLKALQSKGKVVTFLHRVGHQNQSIGSAKPYFCPLCLISDSSNFGQPYWHRSHQLLTLYYCPTHHIPLQNKCMACGTSNISGGKKLRPLPSLVCSCGHDYRKDSESFVTSNEIYRRLTKVSIDALENKEQNWNADNVKSYFSNLALEKLGPKKGETYIRIKHVFMAEEISESRYLIRPVGFSEQAVFRRNPFLFKAPDFCLILASMNIDFATAAKEFGNTPQLKKSFPGYKKVVGLPESVEVAFSELSKRRKRHPKVSLARYKTLYWYLRFNGVNALKMLTPNVDLLPIPSCEDDRTEILNTLSKHTNSKYKNTAAIVRATIRDSAWLDDLTQQKYKESKVKKIVAQQHIDDKLIEILKHKLKEILDNERRPERITFIRLGSYIGFSASQIIQLLKKYPEFSREVKRINEEKPRRQLVWAAKELKNEGVVPTTNKIYHKASLPYSPTTSNVVKQLVTDK